MSVPPIRYIDLPGTSASPDGHSLALRDRVLVVIGANGSGKTRFGVWLEAKSALHHRVSAHRSLSFPESVEPIELQKAENQLRYGGLSLQSPEVGRRMQRWKNNPSIALLDDFKPLMTVMVSESFFVSDKYRVQMNGETQYVRPPKTKLDVIKEVWESVLPNRELVISGSGIEVRHRGRQDLYHAKELSDGERGILYLIGEALCVPLNGVFIVDEPELHIHRAIQSRLWDAVEAARPDCVFVYITHDLGFAASRQDATKIWLREYVDSKWDWEIVSTSDLLPEAMLLEVLGSRRPILFVEGERDKLDHFVYERLYPNRTIIPCGSCDHVIHSTKSFGQLAGLHHNNCHGLVDNDGRSNSDVEKLGKLDVEVLPVAQVENLLLLESVLRIAATKLALDPDEVVAKIKAKVFERLSKTAVMVVSRLTRLEMEPKLRSIGKCDDGLEGLSASFANACKMIDPPAIYARWQAEIRRTIDERDYNAALRYYKSHGIAAEVADSVFRLRYNDQILRWLRADDAAFLEALRQFVPDFSSK